MRSVPDNALTSMSIRMSLLIHRTITGKYWLSTSEHRDEPISTQMTNTETYCFMLGYEQALLKAGINSK